MSNRFEALIDALEAAEANVVAQEEGYRIPGDVYSARESARTALLTEFERLGHTLRIARVALIGLAQTIECQQAMPDDSWMPVFNEAISEIDKALK